MLSVIAIASNINENKKSNISGQLTLSGQLSKKSSDISVYPAIHDIWDRVRLLILLEYTRRAAGPPFGFWARERRSLDGNLYHSQITKKSRPFQSVKPKNGSNFFPRPFQRL